MKILDRKKRASEDIPTIFDGITAFPAIGRFEDFGEWGVGKVLLDAESDVSTFIATEWFFLQTPAAVIPRANFYGSTGGEAPIQIIARNTPFKTIEAIGLWKSFDAQKLFTTVVVHGVDDSSTATIGDLVSEPVLDQKLRAILQAAKEEYFEDGIVSQLAKDFHALLRLKAPIVLSQIREMSALGLIGPGVLSELLLVLGRENAEDIGDGIFSFFAMGLAHSSAMVRDAATLGLDYLDDQRGIPLLETALLKEEFPILRREMEIVITNLTPK